MTSELLQINIMTFNRKKNLKYTLEQLLDVNSPVNKCLITIFDNSSTDGSSELIQEYCKKYSNLKHFKHPINIGGSANAAYAFTYFEKKYLWVLGDDDEYDFSNWREVEEYMDKDIDVINVADYFYANEKEKYKTEYQLIQLTFLAGGIYKTSNITTSVIKNMYDNIFAMMPQLALTIANINKGNKIATTCKAIAKNGFLLDQSEKRDVSYNRGSASDLNEIFPRNRTMCWVSGFANMCSGLKDTELKYKTMQVALSNPTLSGKSVEDSIKSYMSSYSNNTYAMNLFDIYLQVHPSIQKKILKNVGVIPIFAISFEVTKVLIRIDRNITIKLWDTRWFRFYRSSRGIYFQFAKKIKFKVFPLKVK